MTNRINRSWREIKVMLKWRFSVLTDADLAFEEDNKEKMLEKLEVNQACTLHLRLYSSAMHPIPIMQAISISISISLICCKLIMHGLKFSISVAGH